MTAQTSSFGHTALVFVLVLAPASLWRILTFSSWSVETARTAFSRKAPQLSS